MLNIFKFKWLDKNIIIGRCYIFLNGELQIIPKNTDL